LEADKSVVLGDEFDEDLRKAVLDVLREMGATEKSSDRGVGGSQEVETSVFDVEGKPLVLEAETYEGLSIRGEEALVAAIEERVKAKRK
jgi:hypothetical protein